VTLLNRGSLADPFGDRVERLRGDRAFDLARLVDGRRFDAVLDLAAYTGEDGKRAAEVFSGKVGHHVMVSTGQVYLVREGCPRPAREDDYEGPVLPRPTAEPDLSEWLYGVGKRDAEDALAGARGLPCTRVRIPMVNGELDYHRRLESYLWRLLDGGPVLLPDGGDLPMRHVSGSEVARFLVSILGREDTHGKAFNLAQEETPTLRELVLLLRELLGSRAPLVAVPATELFGSGLDPAAISPFSARWMSFVDPTRARDVLGFRHEPVAVGMGKVVAAFLAHAPPGPPANYRHRPAELRLAEGRAA
jgi:nucleoside-diphosphate-sugar epimerase